MSDFDGKVIERLKRLEREVERLQVKERPVVITDHGNLAGLEDNDHPQYLLAASGKAADSDKLDNIDSAGFVQTSGNQTVGGIKTFTSIPALPATNPTTANQAVRKGFADATYLGLTAKAADADKLDNIDSTGFVQTSGNQTVAGVKTFSSIPVLPTTNPTAANEAVRKGYADATYLLKTHLTDGGGYNYSVATAIDSNQCFVTILAANGTAPTASNFCTFRIGGSVFTLTSQIGWYIGSADYFKWVAKGIAGNDAQLFVYAINNNGTLCFGVSPSPNLTVVGSYRTDMGGGIGSNPGFSNMVSNVFSFATGSLCRVIGRINVKQGTGAAWSAPTIAKVVNYPIFSTDYLYQTATTVSTYANITNCTIKYRIDRDNCVVLGSAENGAISTTSGVPITIRLIGPVRNMSLTKTPVVAQVYDPTNGWRSPFAATSTWGDFTVLEITKTVLGANWEINDTGIAITFQAEYPIDE